MSVSETESVSEYSPSDYDSSLFDVIFDPKCGVDNNLLYAISVSGGIFSLTIQQYFYPPGAIMVLLPDGPLKNTFINPHSRSFLAHLLRLLQRVSTASSITATSILVARTLQGPYKSRRTLYIEETGEAPPVSHRRSTSRYSRSQPIKHFREKFDWRALPVKERMTHAVSIVNQKVQETVVEPFQEKILMPFRNAIDKTFNETMIGEERSSNASKVIRGKPVSSNPSSSRRDVTNTEDQTLQPYFEAVCRLARMMSRVTNRAIADTGHAMKVTKEFVVKMAYAFVTLLASQLRCSIRKVQWVFAAVLYRFRECFSA
jgi:hypothetical protein